MSREPAAEPAAAQTAAREELIKHLLGFARTHQERLARHAASLQLTVMQAKAVYYIHSAPSMRVLAAQLRCDASNVTSIVDRLEELSLIERQADHADRRVKRLVLTRAGRRVHREITSTMLDAPELDRLHPGEEALLGDLLRKISS